VIRAVVQRDRTGCGVASVAALAGVSYRQAKAAAARLGIAVDDPLLWSHTGHVRSLLRHFGLEAAAGETPFRCWAALPAPALLAIKWHLERGRPCWHWVVFVRGPDGAAVLDPKQALRRNVRTDFGRMRPQWYIQVGVPGRA
jgi:ABC-type bacteriocin/lantibiotic exporter with double-glycine peptidase domain